MTTENKPAVSKGTEVQRVTPAQPMSPFEEMERMFERIFPRGWLRPGQWDWPSWGLLSEMKMPSVDVIERDDEIYVRAELPGVEKKDLDVTVSDTTLTLRGSARREEKEEKGQYFRREISEGSFARTMTLPATVDSERARASFKDGMLELHLPKVEKAKRRSIQLD